MPCWVLTSLPLMSKVSCASLDAAPSMVSVCLPSRSWFPDGVLILAFSPAVGSMKLTNISPPAAVLPS